MTRRSEECEKMSTEFVLRGEYIQLDQLLKATGLCGTGGEAHQAVAAGEVRVDGSVEGRKRAKLRAGQTVSFHGEVVHIKAAE